MITIIRKEDQADGQFNGGAILEKRPVFYQSEKTFPYSNLFYWAHAWTDKGSTIGLHPHTGFEILTFILEGEIEHYDTKNKTWNTLKKGDVQIIRSGNGISHAEKMHAGASIFQIWFDPDLSKTLSIPPSYNDYTASSFPVTRQDGITEQIFIGEHAPVEMMTEGVSVKELIIEPGDHSLRLAADKIYSFFLRAGVISLNENQLRKEDFARVSESNEVRIHTDAESKLFLIETPLKPAYLTYIDQNN